MLSHRFSNSGLASALVLGFFASLVAIANPAASSTAQAAVHNPIPANQFEEITYEFTEADAIFAWFTSDLGGGRICIVPATQEDPSGCGESGRVIAATIGTGYTLIEARPEPGEYRLNSTDSQDTPIALSEVFTVSICDTCSRELTDQIVADVKAAAGQMAQRFEGMVATHALLEKFAGKAIGMRGIKQPVPPEDITVDLGPPGATIVMVPSGGFFTIIDPLSYNIEKGLDLLKFVSTGAALMYRGIEADPPDPNFDAVAVPEFPSGGTWSPEELQASIDGIGQQWGYLQAALHAIERFQGAELVGDAEAQITQLEALDAMSAGAADAMEDSVTALRSWSDVAADDPELSLPVLTASELAELAPMYERVRTTGFAPQEVAELQAAGFTAQDIDDLRTQFVYDVALVTPDVTYPAVVDGVADDLEQHVDAFRALAHDARMVALRIGLGGETSNDAPTAHIATASTTVPANTPVDLDGSDSSDPDGLIVAYHWDFGNGTTGDEVTGAPVYAAPGDYTVSLTVTDDDGATDSDSIAITVSDDGGGGGGSSPVASFLESVSSGVAPLAVSFDANDSTDADGPLALYEWDFGDAGSASGVTASHTFEDPGTYTVTLTVTDGDGNTASTSKQILVTEEPNEPPTASISASPLAGKAPLVVMLDASGSSDSDGTIQQYQWSFGDGGSQTTNTPTVEHTYETPAVYYAAVNVVDDDGASAGALMTTGIEVAPGNERPTVVVSGGPFTGSAPLSVSFDASQSSDADGTIESYEWDFGDGGSGSGAEVSHTYQSPGVYTAELTVTDDLGATASATGTITVLANQAPTPVDDVVMADPAVGFDVLGNDVDPDDDPITLTGVSQPGHGTASCGPDGGCLYVAAAGYAGPDQFSYTVSDGKGGTASASVSVDVRIRTIGGATNLAAIKDVLVTTVGAAESVDALANDSGAGPLFLVSNTDPGHGTVVCSPAGLCTYTPAPGFSGYDGFTYVVSDATGASATAAVEITVAAAANHLPDVAGAPATIVQGATANWIVAAAPIPAGAPGTAPGLQRQLSVALTGNHQLVPGSLTTASGWTSTVTPSGVTLTAGPDAMLGESASQVLPAPSNPISQGSGGDGHVPILVGSEVFAFFHHQFPTQISCVDRATGQRCPGYPMNLNVGADNIPGPGAVVGNRIYVHLRTTSPLASALTPYALYCWDAAADQSCGLTVLDRNLVNGDGSAPVLAAGKIWGLSASGNLHCFDPETGGPCVTPSVQTGLGGSSQVFDIVTHGTKIYVSATGGLACFDAFTFARCAGWPTNVSIHSPNIVNRHSATGVADGVCSVSDSSAECFADGGGAPTTHDGWPLSDGYYNVTQEAEAGTRTIWGSLNRGGLGCWDWSTMHVCAGTPFVDGWVDQDTSGTFLPSAYGATFDGACAVALGDPGLLFTMAPSGQSPCTSLGTGAQTVPVDLRLQRCTNNVGDASWRDVRLSGVDLESGAELSSLVVMVKDALTGEVVASREMVGTGGTIDLSSVDPSQHPVLVLAATATSVAGNPAWADGVPPRIELRWISDPATGCFRTATAVACSAPAESLIGVTAAIGNVQDSDTVSVTRSPECETVGHPPVADAKSVSTPEDTAVVVVLSGSDVDGDGLSFAIASGPLHGSLSGSGASRTYTPDADYHGPDSFTYTASDGVLSSLAVTVSITVTPVNDRPVADAKSVSTPEDTAVVVVLSGSDVDGDGLSFAIASGPLHGSLSGSGASRTYTPDPDYNGPDSFTYSASDGLLTSSPATVSITVTPVNDPPTAQPKSVSTPEDTAVVVVLSGSDVDGDGLSFAIASGPLHGSLSGSGASRTYTPDADYHGPDSFTYTASDGLLTSSPATVTITVTPVNDRPVADAKSVSTPEDTAVAVVLSGSDVDGDGLTFAVGSGPSHGSLSGSGAWRTYTPDADYHGPDSFTYTASDGVLSSLAVTVSITVTPVNDRPVADAKSVSTPEDTAVAVVLSGSDVDGDGLTFAVGSGPSHGSLSGSGASRTYTPDADYHGPDSFTYTASDGLLTSSPATVSITVTPIDDQPSSEAGADRSVVEGSSVAISGTAADADGGVVTTSWSVTAGPDVDAGGTCSFTAPTSLSTSMSCTDDGHYVVTLSVSDGTGPTVVDTFTLTVTNAAPVVTISAPVGGSVFTIGAAVAVTASFTDAGTNDTHTSAIDWGDGATTTGTCSGSHIYGAMFGGLVNVTVTDDDGANGVATVGIAVAPLTTATKVTGGGTFDIGGARHSFGFVAEPSGAAFRGELELQTPGHRFHGETVTSLVVNGTTATWSGTGRWDGAGGARFTVTVTDAGPGRSRNSSPDTISIVIRDAAGDVVFTSNGPRNAAGGNIAVHK